MRLHGLLWAIGIFLLVGSQATAQDTPVMPSAANPSMAPGWLIAQALGGQEKIPQPPAQPVPPAEDVFAQAPAAGGEAPTGLNPRMIGDFPGNFVLRTITVPTFQTITTTTTVLQQVGIDATGKPIFQLVQVTGKPVQVPTTVPTVTRVPAGSSAIGFKVADNQSPEPGDRVFFSYNYFNNLHGPSGAFANPQTITQQTAVNGTTTTTSTVIPGVAAPRLDLHGEIMGFEKAFLDSRFSLGMRVPLFQQEGDGSFAQRDFGDVGVLFNYAIFRDQSTGNILAGGVLLTLPTGPAVDTTIGNIHSTIVQPFMGYRWRADRFYVHGFTSVAVPTNEHDVTSLFNDVGIGYWLYRGSPDRLLSAVIPTFEAHVTTPLNHRQLTDPVTGIDILALTSGVHLGLGSRSMLTLGVVAPVTGPRPYNVGPWPSLISVFESHS